MRSCIQWNACGPLILLAVALSFGGRVEAGQTGYAVFGAKGVNLSGATIDGGIVGSNGDVTLGSFATVGGLAGGGNLNANGPTVNGDVTFNGNISLAGANVAGSINGGSDVVLGAFANTHAITARGDVIFNGSTVNGNVLSGIDFTAGTFSRINGDAGAGHDITNNGTINGNVTYGNTIYGGGTINGTQTQGSVTVNPTAYQPYTLPPAASFSSGGTNVTNANSGTLANPLAPGQYGNVNISTFGNIYLTAGTYYFNNFNFQGSSIHLLNLTAQDSIIVYVTGDISLATFANFFVDEKSYSSADKSLAANVLFETLGNYSMGDAQLFGTAFAPDGNISVGGFANITGSLLAGGTVTGAFGGFTQSFVPAGTIPEPASIVLTSCGFVAVALVARRGRRSMLGSNRRD